MNGHTRSSFQLAAARDSRGAPLTPTLDALHRARKARLQRFAQAAARVAAPAVVAAAAPVDAPPEPPEFRAFLPRSFKPAWFRIEDERDADAGPEVRDIQQAVCLHYGVSLTDLLSERRMASIVRPRQVAVYLARELTLLSLPQIGQRFGGRDHTTMLVSHRKIARQIASDAAFAAEVAALRAAVSAPARAV
jgi:hypothetical protein